MTNNEAYWTERALKRAEEAYLHDAALTAKLFQEYESAAKAIKREISAFYSKYAGKYGLTYDQAVRLLNRKEFQEWKASLAEYVDYIATIQDPKVKALLTAQLDALSANSSISRLEALQGQIDLILNDLFDKGVAQICSQNRRNLAPLKSKAQSRPSLAPLAHRPQKQTAPFACKNT